MTHICYLTGMFPRQDSLIFHRQGKSMAAAGHRVTYVVCDEEPDECLEGVSIVSCRFKPESRLERMLKTRKVLFAKALEVDAEVYQISEPELLPLGLKLLSRGKKVIYNMREYSSADLRFKTYVPAWLRLPGSWLLERYMRSALRKYQAVFSVTPELVDVVEKKWGIAMSYLLANFPMVDTDFKLSKEDYLKRDNVLAYIGTIYDTSRQEVVFQALEALPEVSYLMAGILGSGAHYVTELPYWRNVKFIDGFKRQELSRIFALCTMSNVLRDDAASGTPNGSLGVIKLFESMEAALPILCSDVPVNRALVEEYRCGICVNPNRVDQVEDALRYLLENKEVAYEMGQNGRRAVLEKYNWESQFRLYEDVIGNLTGKKDDIG